MLRQELSDVIVEGPQERYRLDWPGKREALLAANAPIAKTLRPCREESVDFDTTKNLFIEGDNLEALKILQETFLGKIDVIYIDPPYNTGSDLVYDDSYVETAKDFSAKSGQVDSQGNRLFINSDSNGRFHSDWLSMVFPRLKLARNLLSENGIILVSIDDNEIENLRMICDEVFGEVNFISQLFWEKGRKNDAKLFSIGHDYILVYARSKEMLKEKQTRWREAKPGAKEIQDEYLRLKKLFSNDDELIQNGLKDFYSNLSKKHPSKKLSRYSNVDKRGVWRDDNMSWPGGGGPRYDVVHPVTGLPCAVPEGGWRYSKPEKMKLMIDVGRVMFRADHTESPIRKTYLVRSADEFDDFIEEEEEGDENEDVGIQVAGTYFYRSALQASSLMLDLFGSKVFDSPKDPEIISRWIRYVSSGKKDALVLDFFAGSGTTAHSVMDLNKEDGGNRRWILVQYPEFLDSNKKDQKVAAEFCNSINVPTTIAEITKERIRRVAKKFHSENPDSGFRVLKIDESNFSNVFSTPGAVSQESLFVHMDNIRDGRTSEDLLFQVLLDWGVDLALPILRETLAGKEVFFVDETALAACFEGGIEEEFVKALAKRKPLRVVFRDSGFADDSVKINVEQIFKSLSPDTEVKVI